MPMVRKDEDKIKNLIVYILTEDKKEFKISDLIKRLKMNNIDIVYNVTKKMCDDLVNEGKIKKFEENKGQNIYSKYMSKEVFEWYHKDNKPVTINPKTDPVIKEVTKMTVPDDKTFDFGEAMTLLYQGKKIRSVKTGRTFFMYDGTIRNFNNIIEKTYPTMEESNDKWTEMVTVSILWLRSKDCKGLCEQLTR